MKKIAIFSLMTAIVFILFPEFITRASDESNYYALGSLSPEYEETARLSLKDGKFSIRFDAKETSYDMDGLYTTDRNTIILTDDNNSGDFTITLAVNDDNNLKCVSSTFSETTWHRYLFEFLKNEPLFIKERSEYTDISVYIDDNKINFEQPPILENDRVLVPMRLIFEAMGADVRWDGNTQTIESQKGYHFVTMQIGNNTMTSGKIDVFVEVPPKIIDGRTFVPLRAVAESFDSSIKWLAEEKTVLIKTYYSEYPYYNRILNGRWIEEAFYDDVHQKKSVFRAISPVNIQVVDGRIMKCFGFHQGNTDSLIEPPMQIAENVYEFRLVPTQEISWSYAYTDGEKFIIDLNPPDVKMTYFSPNEDNNGFDEVVLVKESPSLIEQLIARTFSDEYIDQHGNIYIFESLWLDSAGGPGDDVGEFYNYSTEEKETYIFEMNGETLLLYELIDEWWFEQGRGNLVNTLRLNKPAQ